MVLDCVDPRALAEFYRELLGLSYRPGDEVPDQSDWLVLCDSEDRPRIAFQRVESLSPATWPEGPVPQQLHLDLTVPTTAALDRHNERALSLGARLLLDRSVDEEEPLRVYADPAGHPFCVFVATTRARQGSNLRPTA